MTVVADSPRRAVAHRPQEFVEVAADEPALTAGRPVDGDKSLVRPLAQRRGAHADVGGRLTNVEKPWTLLLKHPHGPYFGANRTNLDRSSNLSPDYAHPGLAVRPARSALTASAARCG